MPAVRSIEELKQEEVLTIPEAARLVRIPRAKMYGLVKAKRFRAVKLPDFPNTWKILRKHLDEDLLTYELGPKEDTGSNGES